MASGIYQLTFTNGMRYIGKSNDIDRRWKEHKYNFDNNKAAAKMQAEFKRCGYPTAEVLLNCHKDHLDILETYLIATMRPELNTRIELPISRDDYYALMQQSQLLEDSTVEHIKFISNLVNVVESLEEEVATQTAYITELEKDIDAEKMSIEYYAKFHAEVDSHTETVAAYEIEVQTLIDQLKNEKNKSWIAKLFGR